MFGMDDVIKELDREIKGLRKDVQEIRDILKVLLDEKIQEKRLSIEELEKIYEGDNKS